MPEKPASSIKHDPCQKERRKHGAQRGCAALKTASGNLIPRLLPLGGKGEHAVRFETFPQPIDAINRMITHKIGRFSQEFRYER